MRSLSSTVLLIDSEKKATHNTIYNSWPSDLFRVRDIVSKNMKPFKNTLYSNALIEMYVYDVYVSVCVHIHIGV